MLSQLESQPPALIVMANRLPFILRRNEETGKLERKQSAGGLVTAVEPVVIENGGLWIGWPGIDLDEPLDSLPECPNGSGLPSSQAVVISINKETFDNYYNGCCNGTFWPLLHSMPDRAVFQRDHWEAYQKVNDIFAHEAIKALRDLKAKGDGHQSAPIVWIHDYHLMLCGSIIRQAAEEENLPCRLGFFLHIPFPPWDIFRLYPQDDIILQGLLGNDLVGFHIEDYARNFLDCCQQRLGVRVDQRSLLAEVGNERTVKVRALPIGIPYDKFRQMALSAPRIVHERQFDTILGVDRLDYTKGLVQRMKAFERFLEKYPEFVGHVIFIQIAVPSRTDVKEYQMLKEEMDMVVGRINGRFSTANWSPIRYIYGCIKQEELAAFYRDSAVALVTPLRDGMNLVAKEYVACQVDEPGVLVLSPFAGAGKNMHEALQVNPYDVEDVADMLYTAMTMPEEEKRVRMFQMKKREEHMDVVYWLKMFLQQMGLEEGVADNLNTTMPPMALNEFDDFLHNYIEASCKLALLLDYDGTLAPIAPKPDLALLPNETRRVLQRLANYNDVMIAVVSGRSLEDVKAMVGIEGITYAGNHGLDILHPDGSKFSHPVPQEFEDAVRNTLKQLQEEACEDGAWVENKGAILTYHFRAVPDNKRKDLTSKAIAVIERNGLRVCFGHCSMEAWPRVQWHKGKACMHILRSMYGVDWFTRVKVIYVGDDVTDEYAMRELKGIARTFRVTSSQRIRTAATRRLNSTDNVLTLLRWVELHMGNRTPCRSRQASVSIDPKSPGGPDTYSVQMSIEDPGMINGEDLKAVVNGVK